MKLNVPITHTGSGRTMGSYDGDPQQLMEEVKQVMDHAKPFLILGTTIGSSLVPTNVLKHSVITYEEVN